MNLSSEQTELLRTLISAARQSTSNQRQPFMCIASGMSYSFIVAHPGIPDGHHEAYPADLDALAEIGLIRQTPLPSGGRKFDLTQRAYEVYEKLQREAGEPVQRVEAEVRKLIDADAFRRGHPTAHAKWADAEDLLWQADADAHLSTIGHLCREALQEFAASIARRHRVEDPALKSANTVQRIRTVFDALALGGTERAFLDALLAYWGTVHDLVQRQEHAGAKEGRPITWEDGRRVVFHSLLVMYEIEQASLPQA